MCLINRVQTPCAHQATRAVFNSDITFVQQLEDQPLLLDKTRLACVTIFLMFLALILKFFKLLTFLKL